MKRISSMLAYSLLSTCAVCRAQSVQPLSRDANTKTFRDATTPQALRLQSVEYVIPQLILGGEWTSTIKFLNLGSSNIPPTNVYFVDNTGKPMTATFQASGGSIVTDAGFSFFLNAGNMMEVTFVGGANTQFGHAIIGICSASGCTPGLYGEVTLRNHNATRPDFESVFPLEQPAPSQYMLFDGRNGNTTLLYLINETTAPSVVSIDVVNAANQLIRTVTVNMVADEAQLITLHVMAQETIGIQGKLVIRGQNSLGGFVTATALRINPSNSFTPMRAFVPAQ